MGVMKDLDLTGDRLAIGANDDDFKIVTFYLGFDPTVWTGWTCLLRTSVTADDLVEWAVEPIGTPMPEGSTIRDPKTGQVRDVSGKYPLLLSVDTLDFGEGNRVFAIFANKGEPDRLTSIVSGIVTTSAVVQEVVL